MIAPIRFAIRGSADPGSGAIPAVGSARDSRSRLRPSRPPRRHWKSDPAFRFARSATAMKSRWEAMQGGVQSGDDPAEDVFVTTKLWNTNHRPERVRARFEASCRRLQIDTVDCYLIHTPFAFQPGDEQDPRDERGQSSMIPGSRWSTPGGRSSALSMTASAGDPACRISLWTSCRRSSRLPGSSPAVCRSNPIRNLPEWELLDFCRQHGIVLLAFARWTRV